VPDTTPRGPRRGPPASDSHLRLIDCGRSPHAANATHHRHALGSACPDSVRQPLRWREAPVANARSVRLTPCLGIYQSRLVGDTGLAPTSSW